MHNSNNISNILINDKSKSQTSLKCSSNNVIENQEKLLKFPNTIHSNENSKKIMVLNKESQEKISFIHFSPKIPVINRKDTSLEVSKTLIKKKHNSLTVLSDLFNSKFIHKAASLSAAVSMSGESYRKTINRKEQKKSNSINITEELKDKKKKKRKSYIKILQKNIISNKGSHHVQQEEINEGVKEPTQTNVSFTEITFSNHSIDTQNINTKNSKQQKKNKMKIRLKFSKLKNNKNKMTLNNMKIINDSNNSNFQNSFYHSKSKKGNMPFSSILHQSSTYETSSMEYKVNLRHGQTARYTRNGNIEDDHCYSFSEDVLNSLSNMDNTDNKSYSGMYQSSSYNQIKNTPSLISIPSRSTILNPSSNYQNPSVPPSLKLKKSNNSLQIKQPMNTQVSIASSNESPILSEYNTSQKKTSSI
jgi:hypothetical protein